MNKETKSLEDTIKEMVRNWEIFSAILKDNFEIIKEKINAFMIAVQRIQYGEYLIKSKGFPQSVAWFIARHVPAKFLPAVDFAFLEEPRCEQDLLRIGDVPLLCESCDWRGVVDQAVPDCDGDGSLGCPECGAVCIENQSEDVETLPTSAPPSVVIEK